MGRILASVVLVGLFLLAGCLEEANTGGSAREASRLGSAPRLGAFPDARTYVAMLPDGSFADPSRLVDVPDLVGLQRFLGHPSYEPTIGIDQQTGTLFMSGLTFGGPGSAGGQPVSSVLRSKDLGATWENVMPTLPAGGYHNPPVTFDPFVITDPLTGRVYTADLEALLCDWLSWSDDEGESWTTNPMGCGLPPGVHDHQSVITGKPRITPTVVYPNMLYYCVNRIGDSSCAASSDGGLSFGPLVPVMLGVDVEAGGFCGGLHAHVKTDNAGRVFLPKGQCGVPTIGVSEDDGKTWSVHPISRATGIMGHEVNVAADHADNLYAFWMGSNGLPYLSMSKDHGRSWTPARNMTPPGVTATDKPAIHASGDGMVAVTYVGTTHPRGYANNQTTWVGATWNAYLGILTDAWADDAIAFTTTINDPADPIAINQCGGTRCGGLYDFIDVEIDPAGRPWAALVDVCFEKCLADFQEDPESARHEPAQGFAGTLRTGPALVPGGGALTDLLALADGAKET